MRDFKNNPLKKNEAPSYEDLYELYVVRNMSKKEVGKHIGKITYVKYLDIYGIKKDKDKISECRRNTNINKYGVSNISLVDQVKHKKQETSISRYDTLFPNQSSIIKPKLGKNKFNFTYEQRKEYVPVLVEKYWKREWANIKTIEFPPTHQPITDEQCIKEINSLQKSNKNNKTWSPTIIKFHASLKHANRVGHLSPYDYWQLLKQDEELFKKYYYNRLYYSDWFNVQDNIKYLQKGIVPDFIYGVGLSTSRKAPMVSYFKPALAKNIITTYLNEYDTIFDPCSGYSGRMLGSLCAGKNYIGYDINDVVIKESNYIYNTFEKYFTACAQLFEKDSLEEKATFDCLFTCTPYLNIEEWINSKNEKITNKLNCDEWIDILIENFNCKRYIFVTDDNISKYKPYVVDVLNNTSHLGDNAEYIVMVDKT